MINLDERYHEYLQGTKKLRIDGANERLQAYGWHLIEDRAQNLTKGQCDRMLKEYIRKGENPNDLRAVSQEDPRFPTKPKSEGWLPTNF